MANDEEMLVGQASILRYDHFTRVLAYWCQHLDPDGAEDDAEAKRDSRRVHLSQGFGDLWFLDGVLDPINGAIVSEALRHIADELIRCPTGPRPGPGWARVPRAVQVRDQECFHPLCDQPAEFCQIDHVEHRLAPLAGKTWCRLRRRSFPFRPARPAAPATGRRRLRGDRGDGTQR